MLQEKAPRIPFEDQYDITKILCEFAAGHSPITANDQRIREMTMSQWNAVLVLAVVVKNADVAFHSVNKLYLSEFDLQAYVEDGKVVGVSRSADSVGDIRLYLRNAGSDVSMDLPGINVVGHDMTGEILQVTKTAEKREPVLLQGEDLKNALIIANRLCEVLHGITSGEDYSISVINNSLRKLLVSMGLQNDSKLLTLCGDDWEKLVGICRYVHKRRGRIQGVSSAEWSSGTVVFIYNGDTHYIRSTPGLPTEGGMVN